MEIRAKITHDATQNISSDKIRVFLDNEPIGEVIGIDNGVATMRIDSFYGFHKLHQLMGVDGCISISSRGFDIGV